MLFVSPSRSLSLTRSLAPSLFKCAYESVCAFQLYVFSATATANAAITIIVASTAVAAATAMNAHIAFQQLCKL